MPAKGKSLEYGERYNPLNKKLWKAFCEKTGIKIDYLTFKEIIWTTNGAQAEAIADDGAGIHMYEQLGNIVVTKYKSNKVPTDWKSSVKLKRYVPLLNLHSFGYIHHIKWWKMGMSMSHKYIYKFKPDRKLSRSVAANVKAGNKYFKWENSDFWSTTKMDRTFNKFFKVDTEII